MVQLLVPLVFEHCAVGRVHPLVVYSTVAGLAPILSEVSCEARLRRKYIVWIALFAVLGVLCCDTDEVLIVVYVPEFGMCILSEHQGGLHESGASRLACEAKVKKSAIVEIVL